MGRTFYMTFKRIMGLNALHCIDEDEKESFVFYYLIVEWKKTSFGFIESTAKRNVHQTWQIVHQINGVVRTAFIAQIPLICLFRLHWKLFTFRIHPLLMQMDEECVKMHFILPPKQNVIANYYSFVFTALYVTDASYYSFLFFFFKMHFCIWSLTLIHVYIYEYFIQKARIDDSENIQFKLKMIKNHFFHYDADMRANVLLLLNCVQCALISDKMLIKYTI